MAKETTPEKATPVFMKSEFWVMLATNIAGLCLAFGVITPDQAKDVGEYVPNIVGAVMSLLASFKLVNTQHAAKVEVFRAMYTASLQRSRPAAAKPGVTAQDVGAGTVDDVARIAKAAGL